MNKTRFAIGCLVQWYECDIIEEYVETLNEAISVYDGDVIVDFCVVMNEDLEKCISEEQKEKCVNKILKSIHTINTTYKSVNPTKKLITIADYRRTFNDVHCEDVDVLVWGESDMLVPKQMFVVLDQLHQQVKDTTPKYLSTFGICKMWDDSWKPLEHVDFTDKQHSDSDKDWWGVNYPMNKDEMNEINDKVEELQLTNISPHKYNGCGLVISSEVIKSGVNIPRSVFFVHEDTAFMLMTQKVLGMIPQYHFKNILLVHNRKHPEKRNYIEGESGATIGQKRKSNNWYQISNKFSEKNVYNTFNPNYKSYNWKDVFNYIKND